MSRQFNLRVSDQFVERLDRVAKRFGQPMSAVIESLGTPALEAAEADAQFEAEAHDVVPFASEHVAGDLEHGRFVIHVQNGKRSRGRSSATYHHWFPRGCPVRSRCTIQAHRAAYVQHQRGIVMPRQDTVKVANRSPDQPTAALLFSCAATQRP